MSCNSDSVDVVITQLEELLYSGANSVSTDGESVSYNLKQVRQTLQELKQCSTSHVAQGLTRPRMWRPRFGEY